MRREPRSAERVGNVRKAARRLQQMRLNEILCLETQNGVIAQGLDGEKDEKV